MTARSIRRRLARLAAARKLEDSRLALVDLDLPSLVDMLVAASQAVAATHTPEVPRV